jgi:hypothetical protein
MGDFMANYGIVLTYILLAIAALAALVFPIKHMIEHPKKAKQVLVGLGVLIAVYILSNLLASNEVTEHYAKFGVTENVSKQVGTGLIAFYILAVGAVASAVYAEVAKKLK